MEPDRGLRELAASRHGAPAALLAGGSDCVLYGAGDRELLLVAWSDVVLATSFLYCPWASPPPPSVEFPLEQVRAARSERWPDAGSLLARVEGEEVPATPGWRRRRIMVARAEPSPGPPRVADGVEVRPAGAEHRVAVLGMLLAALRNGYAGAPRGRVERMLEVGFAPELEAGRMRALVALAGGEVAGHAVYRPRALDDLTAEPYVELVDTYVLPGHEGTGLARLLTRHVEAVAAAERLPLLGEVICDPDGAWQALYGNLRTAGWTPAWTLWEAPLDGAATGARHGPAA